ncbi:MAG: hypothetical protein LJE68_16155 [Rhodobacter sp.]|nr:hypothetical protein [Rhodobacter sp.]
MDWKHKKPALMGLVGGLGVVAALGGIVGLYPWNTAIFAAFAIWIIGATFVNFMAR